MASNPEKIYISLGRAELRNVRMSVSNPSDVTLGSADRIVGTSGTTNYARLTNKPAIDNHELRAGNNTLDEIGVQRITSYDLIRILT